ncbi:MAG: hypothetical protein KKD73_03195 [Proteobacteria bacterium]|nr:hypothetical protein [Pseudomonadota bacterium]MBU1640650.1 hypothetical protein [Pseudomonadota bacterium]
MILRISFDQSDSMSRGYQVLEILDELDRDYTFLAEYERCYFSLTELKEDIAEKLQVDPAEIELEEV